MCLCIACNPCVVPGYSQKITKDITTTDLVAITQIWHPFLHPDLDKCVYSFSIIVILRCLNNNGEAIDT